jgi:uncharacterized membrane protein
MMKVPAPISSVALDSFPPLIAAVLLGPAVGALAGTLGHLASAFIGGFPMGPLHVIVAAEMAVIVWVYGKLYTSGLKRSAFLSFVFLNGLAAPAPFIFFLGIPFYLNVMPSLTIAAVFNGIIAYILLLKLASAFTKRYSRIHA